MDVRKQRAAENESKAREVNELIEGERGADGSKLALLCECSHPECMLLVKMTASDYERIRAHPRRFVIVAEHLDADIETVVGDHPGLLVVEKRGEAGERAQALDPRT